MIVVRYVEREKRTQASEADAANAFAARNIAQGWIAADMREAE